MTWCWRKATATVPDKRLESLRMPRMSTWRVIQLASHASATSVKQPETHREPGAVLKRQKCLDAFEIHDSASRVGSSIRRRFRLALRARVRGTRFARGPELLRVAAPGRL